MKRQGIYSWFPPLFLLLVLFLPFEVICRVEGESPAGKAASAPPAPVIEHVALKNIAAGSAVRDLEKLFRQLNIRPRVEINRYGPPGSGREVVFLKGDKKDVETVKSLLGVLDNQSGRKLYLTRFPLLNASAKRMKERLLHLAVAAGMDVKAEQFIVYPSNGRGSLFFLGPRSAGDELQELRKEFDKERHLSATEAWLGYREEFRNNLFSGLGKVLVYLFLAIILIAVHYILTCLPLIGGVYERFFSAIWNKLLADFKGRDFALAVIRAAAAAAVEATEEKTDAIKRGAVTGEREPSFEKKKEQARRKALVYLDYRGINLRDKRVIELLDTFIESRMFEIGSSTKK